MLCSCFLSKILHFLLEKLLLKARESQFFFVCFFLIQGLFAELREELNPLKESGISAKVGATPFFLAEAYRNKGDHLSAIYWYKDLLEKGAEDFFEIWFSKWMIGKCKEKQGLFSDAIYWYLEAVNEKPERVEPLYDIARLYRIHGRNQLAYFFAKKAKDLLKDLPREAVFFEGFCPRFVDLELSIVSYYTPHKEEGVVASDRLLFHKGISRKEKNHVYRNLLFYVKPLPKTREVTLTLSLPEVTPASSTKYQSTNPSILRMENGYKVLVRAVNYRQKGGRDFYTEDPDGTFRTRNFLIDIDKSFSLKSQVEVLEDLARVKYPCPLIQGLEDGRLFSFDDSLWLSCTTKDTNEGRIPKISLCKLEEMKEDTNVKVTSLTPLSVFDPNRCEKNWLPFVKDGNLYFLYSFYPLIILQPDLFTGECEVILGKNSPLDLANLRGSAAPIPFEGGFLILVHEVFMKDDYSRCYLHRFVYLNEDFYIEKISRAFVFDHIGIEFCCGMAKDHTEKSLVLSYGVEDCMAKLCMVAIETVSAMLEDVPL